MAIDQQAIYANLINSGKAVPLAGQVRPAPNYPQSTPPNFSVGNLARQGRRGDTQIAHLTPGEVVVPREVAATNPSLIGQIAGATQNMGGNPSSLVVGQGNINPKTGIQEFATSAEIATAYQNTLGRAPDAAGIANLAATNPNISAADLSAALAGSAEGQAKPTAAQMNASYSTDLGRAPDATGLSGWGSGTVAGIKLTTRSKRVFYCPKKQNPRQRPTDGGF